MKIKNNNYFYLLLSFFLFSFTDGNKKKNDLEIDNIHGHVKSMHEYDYQRPGVDKNDIDPLKLPLDDTTKHSTFNYDVNGNLTEYLNNDKVTLESYTFDNSGNRIHGKTFNPRENTTELKSYIYDDKNNLIEKRIQTVKRDTVETKSIFKYDDKGVLKETDSYSKNKYINKWLYKFDDKGNQTESSMYNGKDSLVERWTYVYDERGNNTELALYQDSLREKYVYTFNDHNDMIEEILYGRFNMLLHDYKWEYTYGKNGNWIKRFEKDNSLWKDITYRVFDYY